MGTNQMPNLFRRIRYRVRMLSNVHQPDGRPNAFIFSTPRRGLIRRHIANRTVAVLIVVPLHEATDPFACCLKALERLIRVTGRILQRPEQAL